MQRSASFFECTRPECSNPTCGSQYCSGCRMKYVRRPLSREDIKPCSVLLGTFKQRVIPAEDIPSIDLASLLKDGVRVTFTASGGMVLMTVEDVEARS